MSDDKVARCAGTRLPPATKSTKESALADELLDAQVDHSNRAHRNNGQHHRYELLRRLPIPNNALKPIRPLCHNLLNLREHRILINTKATFAKHFLLDLIMLLF